MKKISKKGIVYIIINPCFQDWVKIGKSANSDIQVRLKELNGLCSTPLPFFAYAVYFVKDPLKVEKAIHNIIDQLSPDLRAKSKLASGKVRKREFFKMTPEEAYGIFYQIASANGDIKNIKLIEPSKKDKIEIQNEKQSQLKRGKLNLKEIGIPNKALLTFVFDKTVVCKADIIKNKLIFENKSFSISGLALKLLNEKCHWNTKTISGGRYFKYKGQTLENLRNLKGGKKKK